MCYNTYVERTPSWPAPFMFTWLLDFLFPKQCLGCNQWDTWLCKMCVAKISAPGKVVPVEQPNPRINTLYYLNQYQTSPLLQQAIQILKYHYIQELGIPLGQALAQYLPAHHYDYAVPIPLHRRRQRLRGFNQSTVIAQQFSLPILEAVLRQNYTAPQAKLNRQQRLTNLQLAFIINPIYQSQLQGANLLLVDDVYTTGSTMASCAHLLYQAGANLVDGAVLAID